MKPRPHHRLRGICVLVMTAALAVASTLTATAEAIVGGTLATTADTPWSARVSTSNGGLCTGVIISRTSVATAAHCVSDGSAVRVRVGISSVNADADTSTLQTRDVTGVAAHPYYDAASGLDDVALLSIPALDVSGPAVQPLAIADAIPPPRQEATVFGWGAGVDGCWSCYDGYLHALAENVSPRSACSDGSLPETDFCATSPVGAACRGDSGGGLVVTGAAAPGLIGLDSRGSFGCAAGSDDIYVNATMPEIRDFLLGVAQPPMAPRGGSDVSISASGTTITCHPGTWNGSPTFTYQFFDSASGQMLAAGPAADFAVPLQEWGAAIGCRVLASNAGGVVDAAPSAGSDGTVSVSAYRSPHVTLSSARGRYVVSAGDVGGATVTVRRRNGTLVETLRRGRLVDGSLVFRAPRLRLGAYVVCATVPRQSVYLAGRACHDQRIMALGSFARIGGHRLLGRRLVIAVLVAQRVVGRHAAVLWSTGGPKQRRTVRLRPLTLLRLPYEHRRVAVITLTVRQFSHGWDAYRSGSARLRVTLATR